MQAEGTGAEPVVSTRRLSVARADDPPRGGRATRGETEGRDSDLVGSISRLYRGSTGLRYKARSFSRASHVQCEGGRSKADILHHYIDAGHVRKASRLLSGQLVGATPTIDTSGDGSHLERGGAFGDRAYPRQAWRDTQHSRGEELTSGRGERYAGCQEHAPTPRLPGEDGSRATIPGWGCPPRQAEGQH